MIKQLLSEVRQFVQRWKAELQSKLSSKTRTLDPHLHRFQIYWFDSGTQIRRSQCAAPWGLALWSKLKRISGHHSGHCLGRWEWGLHPPQKRHLSIQPPTSTCTAQMRSLEEAIMILLHPLCWRLMLSAGGKRTLSFANTHYNYACLSRYYNLGLKKGPFRTSSAALVKHYRCVII